MCACIEILAGSSMSGLAVASHSTWVRGLKYYDVVVLFVCLMSHSTWVRGLKSLCLFIVSPPFHVALYMGAWIEIASVFNATPIVSVALYMGAWIEISLSQ